jgi:hypothetical protein
VDSGYSVDNPPHRPSEFNVFKVSDTTLYLYWRHNIESDIDQYRLYRNENEDFTPSEETLIAEITEISFYDSDYVPGKFYYYRLAACDVGGNEGLSAVTTFQRSDRNVGGSKRQFQKEAGAVETPDLPLTLFQNHPNPFNPSTSFQFHLPAAGRVVIELFDVTGKHVITLRDEVLPEGSHTATWDGVGKSGTALASGVYFYRLRFEGTELTKRMILLR